MRLSIRFATVLISGLALAPPAAAESLGTAVAATVVSIQDGDTLTVDAHPWPGITVRVHVRLLGIDAPELRARCASEAALARQARDRLRSLAGKAVLLSAIRPDKYGGRVLAVVGTERVQDLGALLLAEGLARPYGGDARRPWCPR